MLYGCDLSHHNGANAVLNAIAQKGDIRFVICKSTEGRTYKDPTFDVNMRAAMNNSRLLGAYHYARPENGNTIEEEALNFVNAVKPYIGNCLLALDWEGEALKYNPEWALAWCEQVKLMTGVKPVIYVQESYLPKLEKPFTGSDFGIWVAKWSDKNPNVPTSLKPFVLWQYTSKPFDLDKFNGNEEQYRKYCEVVYSGDRNEDCGKCYCGCNCCSEKE